MKDCKQTPTQSVYEHGLSVRNHTLEIIKVLKSGEKNPYYQIPDWMYSYRDKIISKLLADSIIDEYTIHHDCGKPFCLTIDENGKRHFVNHSEVSYNIWLSVSGSMQSAKLMKMDMMIHTMKANDIDEFIKQPEAMTLLIVGLAEVHANAEMFGGFESDSFKIKWGQINRRGKAICKKLFKE